jgi:DNA repair protein RadC
MPCPDLQLSSGCEDAASWPPSEDAPPRLRELRGRVLGPGPGVLDDSECLELLCELAEPDAPRLVAAFGSLPEVLGAPAADLVRVAGERAAVRIKLVQELAGRMLARPLRQRCVLSSWSTVVAHLRVAMVGGPREQFRVLFLDKRNRLIADEVMNEGTVDHAPVYPREVMRRALELHATALVVAHNHPAQDPTPSSADVEMTRKLVEAARALGLVIHDHIIVAGQAVASLKTLGLM